MLSEFEFLEKLKTKYELTKIGDDCAVLPKDKKTDLVITSDMLVEDIDFRLDWTTPEFIGHKALAVSLSDVAAMGAKPLWSMVSIGVPAKIWKTDFVDRFYHGYMSLARRFDVELIGGDVSKTPDKIVIDSTAAGEVQKGCAVLRSTARPGNFIFVSGASGEAAAALHLLENGERYGSSAFDNLLLRQLKPEPQVELGRIIGAERLATAMIDLSDGLIGDLFHICQASRVGASLTDFKIPVTSPRDKFIPVFDISETERQIFYGGEDFELLLTVDENIFFSKRDIFEKLNLKKIGHISPNTELIELSTATGARKMSPNGFQHFS